MAESNKWWTLKALLHYLNHRWWRGERILSCSPCCPNCLTKGCSVPGRRGQVPAPLPALLAVRLLAWFVIDFGMHPLQVPFFQPFLNESQCIMVLAQNLLKSFEILLSKEVGSQKMSCDYFLQIGHMIEVKIRLFLVRWPYYLFWHSFSRYFKHRPNPEAGRTLRTRHNAEIWKSLWKIASSQNLQISYPKVWGKQRITAFTATKFNPGKWLVCLDWFLRKRHKTNTANIQLNTTISTQDTHVAITFRSLSIQFLLDAKSSFCSLHVGRDVGF